MNQIIDPTKAVKAVPFLPILTAELLRDFFAGCALMGTLANEKTYNKTGDANTFFERIAAGCYDMADCMLKAREQK